MLLFFGIAGVIAGCASFGGRNSNSSGSDAGYTDNPVVYEDEVKKVRKDNLKTAKEAVEVDQISYKIDDITFTQKLGDHKKEDVNYLTDAVDADGNLTGDEWFVWMDLTVENVSDVEQTAVVNSNLFYGISEDMVIVETDAEAVYINPKEEDRAMNETFYCQLQPEEERKLNLGYIMDGESIIGTLYYGIGSSGSEIDHVNNKFIRVEEYWNEK